MPGQAPRRRRLQSGTSRTSDHCAGMAQNGTGWQLLRRSSSPISKLRNDLGQVTKRVGTLTVGTNHGVGTKWHWLATFEKVFIPDLQAQKRFRPQDRNGLAQAPSARSRAIDAGASKLAYRIGMNRSMRGFLGPFGIAGSSIQVSLFRFSEIGVATWRFVKHPERTLYPFYLHCAVCCGFVKAPALLSAWNPIRAFCPDWT
jgi:hypothetical protein